MTNALVPVEHKTVIFYEDLITAVLVEENGEQEVYVSIRQMCELLGVAYQGQMRRINDDPVLSKKVKGVNITFTPSPGGRGGGTQVTNCLPLDYLNGWLFGINAKRVKEQVRERLILYQERCYKVLADAFVDGRLTENDGVEALIQADPDNVAVQAYQMAMAIAKLARQQLAIEVHLQNQSEMLTDHEVRLEQLESSLSEDATITDAQAAQLSQAVKAVAILLGQQTKRNEFPGVYGELYRRYDCSSYKLLKKKDFESAMDWLNEWKGSLESDTF